jgi:hypothetical protein
MIMLWDWCNWNAFVKSKKPIWGSFLKLSEMNEIKLPPTYEVRYKFLNYWWILNMKVMWMNYEYDGRINEIELLAQWVKANVRIVSEVSETNEFELVPQWEKANVGIVSEVFRKPMKLNCFCNVWNPMLRLFLKFWKPMNLNLLL